MNTLGIIFDFDGTMVENIHIHARCWTAIGKKFGVAIDEKFYLTRITGNGRAIIVNEVLSELMPTEEANRLFDEKEILYRQEFVKELDLIAGLRELLTELKQKNIPAIIASNAPVKNVEAAFEFMKLSEFNLQHLTPNEKYKGKPAPDLFLRAAEIIDVRPENCLVFEDSTTGFQAAESAGMRYIAVTLEKEPAPQFRPLLKIKDFKSINVQMLHELLK